MSLLTLTFIVSLLVSCYSTVIDVVTPSKTWIEIKRSNPYKSIKLSVMVKRQNIDQLQRTLFAVSTPSSDNYGKFLTLKEISDMIAPKTSAIESVKQWLASSMNNSIKNDSIISETKNCDILTITASIGKIEKLLKTKYFDYQSTFDPNLVVSRVKMGTFYHVPSNIAPFLDLIIPTHRFPVYSTITHTRDFKKHGPIAAPIPNYTPIDIRGLYQTGNTVGKAFNNSVSIGSFNHDFYEPNDLKNFWAKYNTTPCVVTDYPKDVTHAPAPEGEIDTQWISSMAQGIPMQVWYTGGVNIDNNFIQWSTNLLNSNNPPWIASVSTGGTEADFGDSFMSRFDQDLMALGVAGISVFFASGDFGAGGGCVGPQSFLPIYPATSPYVTGVGGVYGGTEGETPLGETAWLHGGGGFSNFNAIQSWQKDAVNNYLKNENDLPDSKKYNATGRGFPDISAASVNLMVENVGRVEPQSGTSCSAPISAGIFGLLNDLRKQNKMAPLGWLNPFIYSTFAKDPIAFNDCIKGWNSGCGAETKGFPASDGWDPVSGVGSPNYKVLVNHVIQTGLKTIRHIHGN
eukprot:292665_1